MLSGFKKYSASDLAWIAGALVATTVLAVFFYGAHLLDRNLDLHFHDTYFVVPNWLVSVLLFLLVLFMAFFYKSSRPELRTSLSCTIVLGCGIILILALTGLIAFSSFFLSGGWTIYPPLSALEKDEFIPTNPDFPFAPLSVLAIACQLLIALMTLRTAIRLGQYRSSRPIENARPSPPGQ